MHYITKVCLLILLRSLFLNIYEFVISGALKLKEAVKESKIFSLVLPDRIDRDLIKELEAVMKKNKPKGRKGKKKKKS